MIRDLAVLPVRGLAGAVVVAVATLCGATDANAGFLGPLDLSTGSAGFANTVGAGAFTDTVTFSMLSASTLDASVVASTLGTRGIDFSSITVTGNTNGSSYTFSPLLTGGTDLFGLSSTVIAPGSYTVTFTGTAGADGGSYGGNLGLTPVGGGGNSAGSATSRPLNLATGSSGFSNTPNAGGFTDSFTFFLAAGQYIAGGLTSALNGAQDIDFTQVLITGTGGTFAFDELLGDPVEAYGLSPVFIGAGNYTLTVSGTNSAAGASYGGDLVLSATFTPPPGGGTVPEPETIALMLAALAPLAFASRRRRQA